MSDLRLYSRVDHEYYSPFDIHEALESSLTLLENKYRNRITIHRNYGKVSNIVCSPGQISQVFLNLLSNAEQAIARAGNIWIRTWQEQDGIVVEIRDDGAGIPESIQQKIFDPFSPPSQLAQARGWDFPFPSALSDNIMAVLMSSGGRGYYIYCSSACSKSNTGL